MSNIKQQEAPALVQAFDMYEDRTYFKLMSNMFGTYKTELRTDTLKNWTQLEIHWETPPDKIFLNGQECEIKLK